MEEVDGDSNECTYSSKIQYKEGRHSLYRKYERRYIDMGCAFLYFLGRLRL